MIALHPQFIKDNAGENLVVLSQKEFEAIMEELEDVRLYDEAKKEDNGERIPFEDAFRIVEEKRNKK